MQSMLDRYIPVKEGCDLLRKMPARLLSLSTVPRGAETTSTRMPGGVLMAPDNKPLGSTHTPTRDEQGQGRFLGFLPSGLELGVYGSIELCWHASLVAVCYRFRPLVHLGKTPWGRKLVDKSKTFVTRIEGMEANAMAAAPKRWERVGKGALNIFEVPWKRTAVEWFLAVRQP